MARDQARTQPAFAPPRHESGTVPKGQWVLERGAERIPLCVGESVIGRGADVDIVIDNHRVSRRHAKLTVTDSVVFVEDLGSVNGVRVDGAVVHGKLLLTPGARIAIADQEFELAHADRAAVRATQRVPTQDSDDGAPVDITTRRTHAFQLMLGVVDKAIALGKPEEAERLLGTLLAEVLEEAQKSGDVPSEVAVAASQAALKLARATGKSQWLEYSLRLFLAKRAPLPLESVDELFAIARRASRLDLALLRRYVATLEGLRLSPGDRFVLSRLQNLANMLSAVGPR